MFLFTLNLIFLSFIYFDKIVINILKKILIVKVVLYAFSSFFDNDKSKFPILIYCIILLIYLTFFEMKTAITISSINDMIVIFKTIDCLSFDAFSLNLSKPIYN